MKNAFDKRDFFLRVFAKALARTEIKDTQHLTDCIQYLFADEEGVVVKRDDSAYQPNQRKDGGWYKTKPEVC